MEESNQNIEIIKIQITYCSFNEATFKVYNTYYQVQENLI